MRRITWRDEWNIRFVIFARLLSSNLVQIKLFIETQEEYCENWARTLWC